MSKQKSYNIMILLLMLWLTGAGNAPCHARTDVEEPEMCSTFSPESNWALQFSFNEYLTLSPFSGAALAIKKQLSNQSALRLAISIDVCVYNPSFRHDIYFSDYSSEANTRFWIQYLRYSGLMRRLNFYYGLGSEVGINYQFKFRIIPDYEFEIDDNPYQNYWNLSIGLQGLIGIEYFIKKPLSLYFEYSALLEYSYAWSDAEDSDDSLKMLNFLALPVRFGISLYF